MKSLRDQPMRSITNFAIAALAATALMTPVASHAAGDVLRAKFSFQGLAPCENPPVRNFPIHGEGTGVLSADRSATLDMDSNSEGKVTLHAKLGAAPMEAP